MQTQKQLLLLSDGLRGIHTINIACPVNGEMFKKFSESILGKIVNIEYDSLPEGVEVNSLTYFIKNNPNFL